MFDTAQALLPRRSSGAGQRGHGLYVLAAAGGVLLYAGLYWINATRPLLPAAVASSCAATDFTASVRGVAGRRDVTGTVQLKNQGGRTCQLPSFAAIVPADSKGKVLPVISERTGKASAPKVAGSQEAHALFMWSNWCGKEQDAWVRISFDGMNGYLLAPLQDKAGKPMRLPRCRDAGKASGFVVRPLRSGGGF